MKKAILLLLLRLASFAATAADLERPDKSRKLRRRRRLGDTEATHTSIIGGAQQGSAISYFVRFGNNNCGATLITADTVLTAAHCVDRGYPSTVRVGSITHSDGFIAEVDAANSAIHPRWRGLVTQGNDVAVIKLYTPVDTSTYPLVTLNTDGNQPCPGTEMTTYGFGVTESERYPSNLSFLNTTSQRTDSTKYMLVLASSSTGVCNGDSRGPLLIGDTQYQVTSFVQGGCGSGLPDAFARISTYHSWIQEHVCSVASDTTNFNCGASGQLTGAFRDGMTSLTSMIKRPFTVAATLMGRGPEPLVDPKVFPMGGHN